MRGVVVMAYGTPARREDVLDYYTDIRRGRRPTDEQLADLLRRYDAIASAGEDSLSPLREHTERQRDRIAAALGRDFVVEIGLKHADPRIEDAVARLTMNGAEWITGLVSCVTSLRLNAKTTAATASTTRAMRTQVFLSAS